MKCSECDGVGYKKISATSCAICERCGGTGEVGEVKETNFDRITKSPEALAEWILKISGNCAWCRDGGNPKFCPCDGKSCLFEDDGCVEWLKQESE